ncbi:MAG: hypothetical protein OXD48_03255, partial [Litoreibacter sp.]|nr:hypothetical protein [Litoreibacter sp.]
MNISKLLLNSAVAAFLMIQPSHAEEDRLNSLFERLQTPDLQDWEQVEQAIWREWSQSGSKSMDLLLQRGRRAMSAG